MDICLESLGAMLEYCTDISNMFAELNEINVSEIKKVITELSDSI